MRMKSKWFGIVLMLALLVAAIVPGASAAPAGADGKHGDELPPKNDNRSDPLTARQQELKQMALDAKLDGKAQGRCHRIANGQHVELEREGEGALWTVLGEFADLAHNSLPEPDRSVDNTSIWVPDFSREYYMDMLFNDVPGANSMRNFYIEQ
jgi:immune inhibitor A